jgi:hypothetical protein
VAEPINHAQQLADEEFPPTIRSLIPSALRRAYGAVDRVMEQHPFLGTPSGRFHRGDLIVLATEWEFECLIEAGSLPFEPSYEHYAAPTGKHLVMRSRRARITINQVHSPNKKPRKAVFRDAFGTPNMEYLWPEWNAEEKDKKKKHLLILHGYQDLEFANLAVPNPTVNKLIWWSDNLLKVPHAATVRGEEEGPADSPEPEAIENLIRLVRDNE